MTPKESNRLDTPNARLETRFHATLLNLQDSILMLRVSLFVSQLLPGNQENEKGYGKIHEFENLNIG